MNTKKQNEIDVGDVKTLSHDVIEPACGDHPAFLMGREGEQVEILEITKRKDYNILVEGSTNPKKPWWANKDDFINETNQ